MSSETSTESESLQPWQLFTLAGLVGATIVVFVSRGQSPAAVILLSITIFTAAAVGVAAWRTFAPLAAEEDVATMPVVGGRTRAALEREKALVLRSIKELEFDRAMGKVSEKDFAEMSGRLRVRAARLMKQLDEGTGYRALIDKELGRRLERTAGAAGSLRDPANVPGSDAGRVAKRPAAAAADDADGTADGAVCAACSTANDADARFCKQCGASLGATA